MHSYATVVVDALERLEDVAKDASKKDELEPVLVESEQALRGDNTVEGGDDKKKVKGVVSSLWGCISGMKDVRPALKARSREVCARSLQKAISKGASPKMDIELSRAWQKTGREWLCARVPVEAVRCIDVAIVYAEGVPSSHKTTALLADCYTSAIEARWKADQDPLVYAASVTARLWGHADDATRTLDLFYDMAEEAHNTKKHGACIEILTFALESSSQSKKPILPEVQARMLRLESHSYHLLGNISAAKTSIETANSLHPTCVGTYLLCRYLVQLQSPEAQPLIPVLLGDAEFTPKMALTLAQGMAQCNSLPSAVAVLKGCKDPTPECKVRLLNLLCETGELQEAFEILCSVGEAHMKGATELTGAQLAALYTTAFGRAQCLPGEDTVKWLKKVAEIVPPSKAEDRAKTYRALANIHFNQEDFSEALAYARLSQEIEASSAYTAYLLIKILISMDDVTNAQEDILKLGQMKDPILSKIAASCAQYAYGKGYPLLAGDALAVMKDSMDVAMKPQERLQLLVNMFLCYEQEGIDKLEGVIQSAAQVMGQMTSGVSAEELEWWRCKADQNKLYNISVLLSKLLGDVEGEFYGLLRYCSVTLESKHRDVEQELREARELAPKLNGDPKVMKVLLLLVIKSKVALKQDVTEVLKELACLDGVTSEDFDVVAIMVAPGTPNHSPSVHKQVMKLSLQAALPSSPEDVPHFAALFRKCMTDAEGRDQQWELVQSMKDVVAAHHNTYPPAELEWLAAESWNNGIYYHRLSALEKSQVWTGYAHTLAQLLPHCETRSEISTQFDIVFNQ